MPETITDPTAVETPEVKPETEQKPEQKADAKKPDDASAELEKWKALARQNETKAKANAAAAKKLEELEAAQKTDLEREQERATKAEERAAAAEAKAKTTAIRAAVVAAAAEAGAILPADLLGVLPPDSVTVTDEGTVEGAVEAVKAALDARPHWKSPTRPVGTADGGARGGTPTNFKDATQAELAAALAAHGIRPRST